MNLTTATVEFLNYSEWKVQGERSLQRDTNIAYWDAWFKIVMICCLATNGPYIFTVVRNALPAQSQWRTAPRWTESGCQSLFSARPLNFATSKYRYRSLIYPSLATCLVLCIILASAYEMLSMATSASTILPMGANNCGLWKFDHKTIESNETVQDLSERALKEDRAAQYAMECYWPDGPGDLSACNYFAQPSIPYTRSEDECPFENTSMCSGENHDAAITFDTGVIDSTFLGIHDKQAIHFRRKTTCVPIDSYEPFLKCLEQDECSVVGHYVQEKPSERLVVYDPDDTPISWTLRAAADEPVSNKVTTVLFSSEAVYINASSETPGQKENEVLLDSPNDDARPDPFANFACVDETQLGDSPGQQYWDQSSQLYEEEASPAYWLMKQSLQQSNTYFSLRSRAGAGHSVQQRSLTLPPISDDLWVKQLEFWKEMDHLFATSLARAQFDAWSIAIGEGSNKTQYYDATPQQLKQDGSHLCDVYVFRSKTYVKPRFRVFILLYLTLPLLTIMTIIHTCKSQRIFAETHDMTDSSYPQFLTAAVSPYRCRSRPSTISICTTDYFGQGGGDLLRRIFNVCTRTTDRPPELPTSSRGSRLADSAVAIPRSHGKESKLSRKRARGNGKDPGDESGDSSGEDDKRRPDDRRRTLRNPNKPGLRCPFYLNSPRRWSKVVACSNSKGFENLNRLRQHLQRVHMQCLRCDRCQQEMPSEEERKKHIRKQPACELRPEPLDNGVSPGQWLAIRSLQGNEEDKYRKMYHILFGDAVADPSPYEHSFIMAELESVLTAVFNESFPPDAHQVEVSELKARLPALLAVCKARLNDVPGYTALPHASMEVPSTGADSRGLDSDQITTMWPPDSGRFDSANVIGSTEHGYSANVVNPSFLSSTQSAQVSNLGHMARWSNLSGDVHSFAGNSSAPPSSNISMMSQLNQTLPTMRFDEELGPINPQTNWISRYSAATGPGEPRQADTYIRESVLEGSSTYHLHSNGNENTLSSYGFEELGTDREN